MSVTQLPKQRTLYFTKDVQDAIVEYNAATDPGLRSRIYAKRIHRALNKLAENIIHTFRFYYRDVETMGELKHEVEVHLMNNLYLYDPARGKAYSYFTTAAKRFLIQYNKRNYNRLTHRVGLDEIQETDEEPFYHAEPHEAGDWEDDENPGRTQLGDRFLDWLDNRVELEFPQQTEEGDRYRRILFAVLHVLKNRRQYAPTGDDTQGLSPRTFYMYVRQLEDASSADVSFITRWVGQKFREVRQRYEQTGLWLERPLHYYQQPDGDPI